MTALTQITGPWQKEADTHIVQVSAGHTFSLFLTNTGMVYATGSSECGQLGNAKTGERLLKGGKSGFDIEVPPRACIVMRRCDDDEVSVPAQETRGAGIRKGGG